MGRRPRPKGRARAGKKDGKGCARRPPPPRDAPRPRAALAAALGCGYKAGVARVLILAATRAYQTADLVAAAQRLGVAALLATDRCHVLAQTWPEGALAIDFADVEGAARAIAEHVADQPIAGVVATDEVTAQIAQAAAARLGLRHNSAAAVRAAANKLCLRRALSAAGVCQPAFFAASAAQEPARVATRAGRELGYPVVLKPLHLSASRGVMRANHPQECAERVVRLARLLRDPEIHHRDPEAASRILVEQFVAGPEFAYEGLLFCGRLHCLALFDKPDPLEGPFFAETIYVTPSQRDGNVQAAIGDAVAAACRAIGLIEGPVHAEVRWSGAGRAVVLEVAARSIGGLCGRALRFGAGLSLEEIVIAHATGREEIALGRRIEGASGVMMLPVAQEGILRAIRGANQARAVPGIGDVVLTARPGDRLVPLPEGHQYLGFLFARGEAPADVVAALRRAAACLVFSVTPVLE